MKTDFSDFKVDFMSALHYSGHCAKFSKATDLFCLAISLATTSGNTKWHAVALEYLARIHWQVGDCFAARLHACEAQRLAGISVDLYTEATALTVEAMAWTQLGNYKHSISLCTRVRDLLVLCGMSGGDTDRDIMVELAEIHLVKSEYQEVHNIRTQILPECPLHWDSYHHAFALMNIAEIGVSINAPKDKVQCDLGTARKIFPLFQTLIVAHLSINCELMEKTLPVSPIMGRKRSTRQPSAPRKRRGKKGKNRRTDH
jgi:hypothetical protein